MVTYDDGCQPQASVFVLKLFEPLCKIAFGVQYAQDAYCTSVAGCWFVMYDESTILKAVG